MRITEADVFNLLRTRYPKASCALLPQVADRTGSPTRFADAIAMQLWPSRGLTIEGFEIKVDRRDWLRELDNTAKAEAVYKFCDAWWIVAPAGIVQLDELPVTWGLLEVMKIAGVYQLHMAVKAPPNPEVVPPTRAFIASIMRSLQSHATDAAEVDRREAELRKALMQETTKLVQSSVENQTKRMRDELERYKKSIDAFERASGVHIDTWSTANAVVMGQRFRALSQSDGLVDRAVSALTLAKDNAERIARDSTALLETLRQASTSGAS